MDQYDYLTRDQLISLMRVLGTARGGDRGNADGLPEFGVHALREFENSSSPMRIFDHETMRYLAVNDAAVKFYGYSREEFLALTLKDTRHPDEHAAQLASLKESSGYFRYGKPRRQIKKSGEIAVVEVVTQDILFGGRKARLALTLDITARLRMQELLWQRQQEFESLADNLPDLVARYDRDRRFVYANSAIERTLGVDRGQIVGKTQRELGLPEELAVLYDDSLAGVFASGEPHKIEFQLALPGGERVYEAHHVAEFDAAGTISSVICVARDITERKQTELAVLRGAALARLLESLARAANEAVTPEAAMVACLERICEFGNWAFGRVALYEDRGTADGLSPRSIWHAPDRERFVEYMKFSDDWTYRKTGPFIGRVLRERVAVWIEDLQREMNFGRREAVIRHGLRSGFAFPIIAHGEVVATMEAYSDTARPEDPLTMSAVQTLGSQLARIVERERAHQANAHMAAIVESSQDAIISRSLDGAILTWNSGAERLFGYTAAEAVGRHFSLIVPSDVQESMGPRTELLRQGRAVVPQLESVRVAKDGRRIPVSTSPAAIRDSSGTVCGISTIIRDMTQRKLAERTLRESEERFRQLAENIDQVFWINTPAVDNNLYVSPAYEKIWGRSLESLRRDPNSWRDAIHPEDLARVREDMDRITRGRHFDIEYRIIRPDGALRWIRDRSYSMKAGDGTPLVCGIAEDITDVKQAEQVRLTHAIHQRDALVREVHHRIKNNLQGVVGLLRQKIRKFPAVAPGIEEAIVQLQTVAVVYGLQGTRADGLLGLAEMVEAICASAEGLIGGQVDLTFERKTSRPACVAGSEAVSMAVALNELVFNALKHQSALAGKKRAQVVLYETRDAAEIRISNRGRLPKGFDYAAGRALGNGLELVRTLLGSPGGDVAFSNGRGKVEVALKLAPPLLAARQKPVGRRGEHGGTSEEKAAAAHTGRG